MPSKLNRLLEMLGGLLLLHLLWIGLALAMASPVLPQPWEVYAHLLGEEESHSMLATHLGASLGRIALGLLCSVVVAFVLALVGYRYRHLGRAIDAFVYLSYPIPKLALLPIVMLLAGLGEGAKVTMVVLIILLQLVVSLRDALRAMPTDSAEVLRSLGVEGFALLRHMLLPALLPSLFSALRLALGTAISVLFVTETYGTTLGMGYYIVDAWMRVDYLEMYSSIILLSTMGFLLFLLIDFVEYLLCPWRR